MSYGARVWNENGQLVMDTTTFTYQIMGQWVLDFSTSTPSNPTTFTLSIPGFDPAKCALVLLPIRAEDIPTDRTFGNERSYPYVTVSPNQAVVAARNPSAQPTVGTCKAIVRAMAMRYA
jgi:hypothetical protein